MSASSKEEKMRREESCEKDSVFVVDSFVDCVFHSVFYGV